MTLRLDAGSNAETGPRPLERAGGGFPRIFPGPGHSYEITPEVTEPANPTLSKAGEAGSACYVSSSAASPSNNVGSLCPGGTGS